MERNTIPIRKENMYSAKQIAKGITHPTLAKSELINLSWRQYNTISRTVLGRNHSSIPDRDWDNLLLLDACRYDLFEEYSALPGDLEPYYSVASNTAEYVRATFKGKECPEIVCVTSTPKYVKPNVEDSFHDIIHVWEDDWDEDERTVLPEMMNERVLETIEEYPNKRILAHYIPPHIPFIGPTGKEIPHQVVFSQGIIEQGTDELNLWESLEAGELDEDRVWQAYRENLEIVLPAVENILPKLPGKTVITSDHGNAFGEFGLYGHPSHRHVKSLIEVPWHVYQNGDRKEVIAGRAGSENNGADSDVVEERLADLGYLD